MQAKSLVTNYLKTISTVFISLGYVLIGTVKEIKETRSIETPTPSQVPKATAVARKSTSTNLFLKENMKQDSASPAAREGPPAVLEVTRIT
jgi:hypothetical protein